MDVIDGQAVTSRNIAIDGDVYIESLRNSLGKDRASSLNRREQFLDVRADALNFGELRTLNLDPNRRLDAR